jgi:hypothetical protein
MQNPKIKVICFDYLECIESEIITVESKTEPVLSADLLLSEQNYLLLVRILREIQCKLPLNKWKGKTRSNL